MPRRQPLATWIQRNVVVTDGRARGRPVRLERWQRLLLDDIDRCKATTFAISAASQIGKTLIGVPVGLRAALGGHGTLIVSATEHGKRDARRRVDNIIDAAQDTIGKHFSSPTSGPGAKSSSMMRETDSGGWLGLASSGSASQLSSRTVRVCIADELARWPSAVRGGEGQPLQLIEARLLDWGLDAKLIGLSSPVRRADPIDRLYCAGTRSRLIYSCPTCNQGTHFTWSQVTGRERGDEPVVACEQCGDLHGEAARRRMLRSACFVPDRPDPTDERTRSYSISRLDSARSDLEQICHAWRTARRRVEQGDPRALAAFRNLFMGEPADTGMVDVDAVYESARDRVPDLSDVEQCVAGADCQDDRIVFVVLGFTASDRMIHVLEHGELLGDPREDEVWNSLASTLAGAYGGLPVSCTTIDAGFLTQTVQRQCGRRRWWIPCVGRGGAGKPIARRRGSSGLCVCGKDDASSLWTGKVSTGTVRLPWTIGKVHVAELVAAEVLVAERGALRWRPVPGRQNHRWDAALMALHSRHFRRLTRTSARRTMRLVAV